MTGEPFAFLTIREDVARQETISRLLQLGFKLEIEEDTLIVYPRSPVPFLRTTRNPA
jgi:hypothetical protein